MNEFSFSARIIENVEIKPEIASDCKLRSKFVHEIFLQMRTEISDNYITLIISENGVKVLRSADQILLSSHSIQRISYSACDRINHLFALVVRSSDIGRGHFCYIFRMENGEEADSVNRYFGAIFKKLHNQKKEKRSKSSNSIIESSEGNAQKKESIVYSSKSKDDDNGDSLQKALDPRLRQISTSNIGELVSEKHSIRRFSLCMLTSEVEDPDINNQTQPSHSSLEKKAPIAQNNDAQPFVRRKKPEYKSNRISAVIERLSFRSSREISSDFIKSGSPVVALKEQLEYEDLLSAGSSLESEKGHEPLINRIIEPRSQFKKQLLPSQSNLFINNDSKAPHDLLPNLSRKNSAPICNLLEEEQPPVPPVRIHSLRNTSFPKTLNITQGAHFTKGCGEGASFVLPVKNENDDDDHLSSITTPSSCGDFEPITFGVYNEPPPPPKMYRDAPGLNQGSLNLLSKNMVSSQFSSSVNPHPYSSSVPMQYFRDFTKDEALEFLLNKEIGCFLLRYSASHAGCMALSVKVAENLVTHYIIHQTAVGFQMKGLEHKTWPNIQALITHLSVIPEMLPCPIIISQHHADSKTPGPTTYFTGELSQNVNAQNKKARQNLPQSQSTDDEYQERMKHFLNDISPLSSSQDRYQQLSDFSSIIAGLDFA